MKKNWQNLTCMVMVALTVGFTACEGDQGEIGPAGPQGDTGTAGAPGEAGEKGDGFSEDISFGNIEVTVSSINPQDEPFTHEMNFKYLDSEDGIEGSSYNPFETGNEFKIRREYRIAANSNERASGTNFIRVSFEESEGEIEPKYFSIETKILIGLKFFELSEYYSTYDASDKNFEMSNYSFDSTTGELKFDFTYSRPINEEETMTITGSADLIVLEGEFISHL